MVFNIQHKVQGGLNVPFISSENLSEDLKIALDWLTSNGSQTEGFANSEYQGFTFAKDTNLQVLRKSGILILMDLTHKSNKHDRKLYTLLMLWKCFILF